MFLPTFAEAHGALRAPTPGELPKLGFAVLRNITVEPMEVFLRYGARRLGFDASVHFGRFDSIPQEASDPASPVWEAEPEIVLVFSRLETLSPRLSLAFPSLSAAEVENEVDHVERYVTATLEALSRRAPRLLLWHGFETPLHPALGIHDSQIQQGQLGVVRRLNESLRSSLAGTGNAYLVDLDLPRARIGSDSFYDPRYWHIGRAPYSRQGLRAVAEECFKFIRASLGRTRKCLALDCDNVLWGGIIGEDGLSGIELARTHPGSAFHEFQQEVLSLHRRGVILALCSKNREADVWEVFQRHPDMVLQPQHISAARINWDDKATNLRAIADELNIGLDSIVFVDDSEFEVELVRSTLPEVEVIHLPIKQAVRARDTLASCGWFDALQLSQEDRQRGQMYRAELKRRRSRDEHADLESYLRSLEMEIDIALVDELSASRAAQLTQRTNQFNLTTRRYSEADILKLAGEEQVDVLTLRLSDRFGEHGLVGVVVLRHEGGCSEIDSLLLSCRVIGRGVEDALLGSCLEIARRRKSSSVRAAYRRSAKNDLVADFYPSHGFSLTEAAEEESKYTAGLEGTQIGTPAYIKAVRVEGIEGMA